MNTVLWGVLIGPVPVAVGFLLPATSDRIRNGGGDKKLREALDDLWGCIGAANIDDLQPETVELARRNHTKLWHAR